jgi:AraC-like DNA-binding protein
VSKGSANLVRASVLAPYLRILQTEPAALKAVFAESDIPAKAVEDSEVWLSKPQVYRFVSIAARLTGQSELGAKAGLRATWKELGPMGLAVQRAANLADAGERARLNLRFSATGAACWVEAAKRSAWFCYRPAVRFDQGADQAELYDLGILLQFVRLALGPQWKPRRLRVVVCSPELIKTIDEFSMARVLVDKETTAVGFQIRFLKSPLKWSGPEHGDAHEEREAPDGTALDAVRRLVRMLLPYQNPPTLAQIAEMMGVQDRTLQRMLSAEGTTFLEALNSVRHEVAADLLETTDAPVKEIARHLGYSTVSNFVRGFRRYSGITPLQARLHHRNSRRRSSS